MSDAALFDILRQALLVAVTISAPILGMALVAGLAVGLFQALTSVQEMTLTFVPKLIAIIAVFWATMGVMSAALVTFFRVGVLPLVQGG